VTDQFLAEIRLVPYNFAPQNWALCNGQIMSISQNTALFSLLGTTYGGNGTTTFGLPDLRGRAAIFYGPGPGVSTHFAGDASGSETVTLIQTALPAHTHTFNAATVVANAQVPASNEVITRAKTGSVYQTDSANNRVPLAPQAMGTAGSGQPHNNLMPYITLNYMIALVGIFPARP
jgi:microcystin-dependent protein